MRCDWLKPDWRHPQRGGLLWLFSVTDTCRAQATSIVETSSQKGYKQRRSHHHILALWKLRKTLPNALSTRLQAIVAVITRSTERGTARVEIQSENSICLTRTQQLHRAVRSIHARAPSVSLLDCAQYFYWLSRKQTAYFSSIIQPLHLNETKEVGALYTFMLLLTIINPLCHERWTHVIQSAT